MIDIVLSLMIAVGVLDHDVCVVSIFGGDADLHRGGPARYLGRRVESHDRGVAHRTLPLGALVAVYLPRTRRVTLARVIDRGPYGARLDDGTYTIKRRARDPGTWRGCIDLAPATAAELGHRGLERAIIMWRGRRL